MDRYNRKIARLGLIGLSLLLFLLSTSGGLWVVWLRQQISKTAASCIVKERELAIVQRKNVYLHSTIAQVHNPEYLKERLESKFALPSNKQIVWMSVDEAKAKMRHLAAKNKNRQVLELANQRQS